MIKLEATNNQNFPWTGYSILRDSTKVGQCAFKAAPKSGQVEMAYYIFKQFENQGIATEVCRQLIELSINADPNIQITARTLMEENASTKVLKNNNFFWLGVVSDPEDGEVWEWIYKDGVDKRNAKG